MEVCVFFLKEEKKGTSFEQMTGTQFFYFSSHLPLFNQSTMRVQCIYLIFTCKWKKTLSGRVQQKKMSRGRRERERESRGIT